METKIVKVDDKEYTIKELNWSDEMDLLDQGFSTKLFMKLTVCKPNIENQPDLFINMNRKHGKILLEEILKFHAELKKKDNLST